jgi:hypothetical protein
MKALPFLEKSKKIKIFNFCTNTRQLFKIRRIDAFVHILVHIRTLKGLVKWSRAFLNLMGEFRVKSKHL